MTGDGLTTCQAIEFHLPILRNKVKRKNKVTKKALEGFLHIYVLRMLFSVIYFFIIFLDKFAFKGYFAH